MATVIGFFGYAFGTVGGFDGGGIFFPMLNLVVGFDTKSAAALSKCIKSSLSYSISLPLSKKSKTEFGTYYPFVKKECNDIFLTENTTKMDHGFSSLINFS